MKPNQETHSVTVTGATASGSFGISKENEAAVMGILRDSLYSDKILAVLREYSANAWDANRMVGRGDVPITVVLPTRAVPELLIRDNGPGLSRKDVFTIYTQYGASTKRSSDDAVGMLGIGSKSGFAYADSFTVTSWHGGTKAIYVAALDPTDRGVINLLHEECLDCSHKVGVPEDENDPTVYCVCTQRVSTETGVQVAVSVKREDISDFHDRAESLYAHFVPRPNINIDLPEVSKDLTTLDAGAIEYLSDGNYNAGKWWALMGCIAYRIDLDQLPLCPEHACLRKLSGTLKFDIGDVQINASRETLQYKAKTKEALLAKFTDLIDAYVCHVVKQLDDPNLKPFERRLRALTISALDLPIPDDIKGLATGWVRLFENADTGPFTMVRHGAATNQLMIDSTLELYLDDTHKNLKGYSLGQYSYVVRGKKGSGISVDDLRALLDIHVEANGLTGVPVKLLSTQPWVPSYDSSNRNPANRTKHRAKMFVLTGTRARHPYSSCWEVETRVPTADDVYVVLENFRAVRYGQFYPDYEEDRDLAKALGTEMPPVYGYKQTKKKPLDTSKIVGTDYSVWRKAFLKSLLTPERAALLQKMWWTQIAPVVSRHDQKRLVKELGSRHPLVRYATANTRHGKGIKPTMRGALNRLAVLNGHTRDKSDATQALNALHKKYPLLELEGISKPWDRYGYYGNHDGDAARNHWLDYVKMVDARENALTPALIVANSNLKGHANVSVSAH